MAEKIGNRYTLVKHIGEGGMADVYLAVDTILKREVAVKILRGELNNDPVNLARFQKEALAISNTSHPNIVEIFDVGEDQGKNYIVMEYVRGKTLKQLIKQRGICPTDEAVNIMKQLVSATANAHKMGIIHRDIKSQNVLVKDDGTVKLSDFGIAYTSDAAGLTQTKTVMGSVHYLAPELAKGQLCTPQSDIYSLGIVFYELLTGDVPYHGDNAVEIALKHLHNDVPFVRDFNPEIPQSVENIIIRATARNKDLRFKSAMEMYHDLVTCLDLSRNNEPKLNLEKLQANQQVKKIEQKSSSKQERVRKEGKKVKKKKMDPLSVMIAMGAVALGIIIMIMISSLAGLNSNEEKVVIPDVRNYQMEEAKTLLESLGLKIETIGYTVTDDKDKGVVISISPLQNTSVQKGSYVSLTVSLGKRFTIENYVGQRIEQVQLLLQQAGITVNIKEVEDSKNPAGTIIYQDIEEGTVMEPTGNKTILLHVATHITLWIPESLKGMDINQAKTLLESQGASVKLEQLSIEENIDENGNYIYPCNTVVNCSPSWNTYYVQTPDVRITLYYY